jgi:hypothetical protein
VEGRAGIVASLDWTFEPDGFGSRLRTSQQKLPFAVFPGGRNSWCTIPSVSKKQINSNLALLGTRRAFLVTVNLASSAEMIAASFQGRILRYQ